MARAILTLREFAERQVYHRGSRNALREARRIRFDLPKFDHFVNILIA
jgi:hypothetical protein